MLGRVLHIHRAVSYGTTRMTTDTLLVIGTVIPTVCYAGLAVVFLVQANPWYALVWAGYASANIGLIKMSGII